MKKYDDLTARLLKRRDRYIAAQKKRNKMLISGAATLCVVALVGVAVWQGANRPTPPPMMPGDTVHTTTVAPTEKDSTTTTTASTTASTVGTTTDGGIVTPPTTAPTTVAPTTSKTEPPKTTAPSKTESTKTTAATAPTKLLITADEPDDAIFDVALFSNKKVYISPFLQKLMESHEGIDATYAVFVSIPPSIEDSGEDFWASTEELAQCHKELNDVVRAFDEEAKRLNPDYSGNPNYIKVWTDTMRTNHERIKVLVEKRNKLKAQYVSSYVETVLNKRFEALKMLCEKEPIDVKCWKNEIINVRHHVYYAELTAEQINTLAKQGGYIFNSVSAEEREEAYSRLIDQ